MFVLTLFNLYKASHLCKVWHKKGCCSIIFHKILWKQFNPSIITIEDYSFPRCFCLPYQIVIQQSWRIEVHDNINETRYATCHQSLHKTRKEWRHINRNQKVSSYSEDRINLRGSNEAEGREIILSIKKLNEVKEHELPCHIISPATTQYWLMPDQTALQKGKNSLFLTSGQQNDFVCQLSLHLLVIKTPKR